MTITLPEDVRADAEARAKAGGYPSVAAYVADLILADRPDDVVADHGPSALTPRSPEELGRMLDAGVASGGWVEADAAFWAERRRVLRERMAAKQAAAP